MKFKTLLLLSALALSVSACDQKPAEPKNDTPAAAAPRAPAGNLVEFKIELPKANIVGTPVPIKIENLEASAAKRVPLMVPEGTKNIALNKPVTASDQYPIVGDLTLVTDGDKDADEGFEVELAPGMQWVQIDLEKESDIYGISVWHYHRQKRAYRNVIVQISNDPEFKKDVTTVFNTDFNNSSKRGAGKDKHYVETNEGKLIPVNDVKGRYVRLYSTGNTSNTGNHYVEVEVYGK